MPRSFGGGRSNSRSRSSGSYSGRSSSRPYSSQSSSSYQTRPQQAYTPSSPARPGMFGGSGLGSTIATGMAFGGGSEIGHQLTRSMIGGGHHGGGYPMEMQNQHPQQLSTGGQMMNEQQQKEMQKQQNPCFEYSYKFVDCLKESGNDISKCQSVFDDLKACEKKFI